MFMLVIQFVSYLCYSNPYFKR